MTSLSPNLFYQLGQLTPIYSMLKSTCYVCSYGVSTLVVLMVQRFGAGIMIERSLVRLPAGALSTRSTQPSIPPG